MRFRVGCFGYGVSGSWFRYTEFQVRSFWYMVLRFGVSGTGFRVGGSGFWRFRVSRFRVFEVQGFRYVVRGFLVFEVRVFWFSVQGFRGSGFRVLWFSRYGVSSSLLTVFEVRGFRYGVSGFRVGGFWFSVWGFGDRVRGSGFSWLGVSGTGFHGPEFRVRGFRFEVL